MGFLNEMTIPIKVVDLYDKPLFDKLEASIMKQHSNRVHKEGIHQHLNLLDEKKEKGPNADPLDRTDGGDEVKSIVRKEMVKYCEELGADKKFTYQKLNSTSGISWWNVLEKKSDWYPMHDHRNWFVSAVLYIRVTPEQQPTRFKSPLAGLMDSWFRPAGRMFGDGTPSAQEFDYFGHSGQLIIFPPWLDHSVPPIMPNEMAEVMENSKLPGVKGKIPVRRTISNSSILVDETADSKEEPRITVAFNF